MNVKKIRLNNIVLDSNVFMAPMAGYTNYAFRMLCYELGCGLAFTEMVSCNGLKYKDKATKNLLYTQDDEKIKAGQILGCNARIIESIVLSDYYKDFDIIDVNMGCPVPNVFKSGEGSALLKDIHNAEKIIKACKKSGKIITVKFRVGINKNHIVTTEFAKMCEASGADLITIHGRTRDMMYDGEPLYNEILKAKECVDIPVIANGGIFSTKDADIMMDRTGADGVMIARHALSDPFIFAKLTGKNITYDKKKALLSQIKLSLSAYGETFTLDYIKKIGSYFMKKQKGMKKSKALLHTCGNIEEMRNLINSLEFNEL